MVEQDRRERDEALRDEIERVLQTYPRIGNLHLPIEAVVEDGCVTLRGWAITGPQKDAAERLAATVSGVTQLRSEIYVDDDLQNAVARKLAEDSRLRGHFPGILVRSRLGDIILTGYTQTEADCDTAEAIAASVPGVRTVSNALQVAPDKLASLQR